MKEEIIKKFRKGHKGEELMEVAEAEVEIRVALENYEKEILEKLTLERGIKWMQEGYNKKEKGYTMGYNSEVDNLEDLKKQLK